MGYKLEAELMLKDFRMTSLEKKLDLFLSKDKFDEIVKKMSNICMEMSKRKRDRAEV